MNTEDLSFFDFATEDKFLFPKQAHQPHFVPMSYGQMRPPMFTNYNSNTFMHNNNALLHDDFLFDLEDRELFGAFEEPQHQQQLRMETNMNVKLSEPELALFDFPAGNVHVKRELESPAVEATKKRRLTSTNSISSLSEISEDSDESDAKFKAKQRRTKWVRKEVQSLWEGIEVYGNNWRLIKKKAFPHRTYYQVKDKGRRILSSQGWRSGRTKATHDGASNEAKALAGKVLARVNQEKPSLDVASNAGSMGTPSSTNTEVDEFDFGDFE